MACPFARLAKLTGAAKGFHGHHGDLHHNQRDGAGLANAPLSLQLKQGTAAAHRAVERSAGVRALMGFGSDNKAAVFDRIDHLRWLIMLGCVYAALESSCARSDNAISHLLPHLVRLPSLLEDTQVHLDEALGQEASSTVDDLVAEAGQADLDDEAAARLRLELFRLVDEAQSTVLECYHDDVKTPLRLRRAHLDLLTARQVSATSTYVAHLLSLPSPPSSGTSTPSSASDEGISFTPPPSISLHGDGAAYFPDSLSSDDDCQIPLVVSHAYVRYLGDLSGGQHIAKRLRKLFPVHHAPSAGFAFYDFVATKSAAELKDDFRHSIDRPDLHLSARHLDSLVAEASRGFEFNTALFDSLVDVEPIQPVVVVTNTGTHGAPVKTSALPFINTMHASLLVLVVALGLIALSQQHLSA